MSNYLCHNGHLHKTQMATINCRFCKRNERRRITNQLKKEVCVSIPRNCSECPIKHQCTCCSRYSDSCLAALVRHYT
jgi:hypothetical protein